MSPNLLASKLLQFASTTSLIVPGAITAEIGSDAVQDCLVRGWIRPDAETGFLVLTDQQSQLQEMRDLAATPDKEEEAPAPAQESASRAYALRHSGRLQETFGLGTGSVGGGAPGSGQAQGGPAPAPPAAPTSPANNDDDYMVGEDVMVADEGKSFQAKIQAKNSDGTYKLSFGPNRPLRQERVFRREEMQRLPLKPGEIPVRVQ